jgi:uncharacterized membrane protein YeaQ/YmgE (transglycosylase-associated protein family)
MPHMTLWFIIAPVVGVIAGAIGSRPSRAALGSFALICAGLVALGLYADPALGTFRKDPAESTRGLIALTTFAMLPWYGGWLIGDLFPRGRRRRAERVVDSSPDDAAKEIT